MKIECSVEGVNRILNTARHAKDNPLHFQCWDDEGVYTMQGDLTVNCTVAEQRYQVHIITPVDVVNIDEPVHFSVDDPLDMIKTIEDLELKGEDNMVLSLEDADDGEWVLIVNDSEDVILVKIIESQEFRKGGLSRPTDFEQYNEDYVVRFDETKEVYFGSTARKDFGFITALHDPGSMWEIAQLRAFLENKPNPDKTYKDKRYMRARRSQQQAEGVVETSPLAMGDDESNSKVQEADVKPEGAEEKPEEKPEEPTEKTVETPEEPQKPAETPEEPSEPETPPEGQGTADDATEPATEPEPPTKPKRRSKEQIQADKIEAAKALLEEAGFDVSKRVSTDDKDFEYLLGILGSIFKDATQTVADMQALGLPTVDMEEITSKIAGEIRDELAEEIRADEKKKLMEKLLG